MSKGIWSGNISFGLVNIPVTLHSGVAHNPMDFTLIDKRNNSPVGYRKVNKRTGEEVPKEDIVKGYEYEDGQYVILEEDDFRRANAEKTQNIEILGFTDLDDIDPLYFEQPYYLEPAAKSDKGFALLREALRAGGKAGIARVVIRWRENFAAVFARHSMLILNVLRYPYELRDPAGLKLPSDNLRKLGVTDREVKMAERLMGEMSMRWDPTQFRDEYREDLRSLIRRKIENKDVQQAPEPVKTERRKAPADLMSLLKQTLDQLETSGSRRTTHHGKTKERAAWLH